MVRGHVHIRHVIVTAGLGSFQAYGPDIKAVHILCLGGKGLIILAGQVRENFGSLYFIAQPYGDSDPHGQIFSRLQGGD